MLTTLNHGIDPANLGKGDWLVTINTVIANYQSAGIGVTDAASLFKYEHDVLGMNYVIVKAASGNDTYPIGGTAQYTSDLVNTAHAAGLKIFPYAFIYGGSASAPMSVTTTVAGEAAVANQVMALGGDGLVIDIEGQYAGATGGPAAAATQYLTTLRATHADDFIAYSSFPYVSLHPEVPWLVMGQYCDATMPQAYWATIKKSPKSSRSPTKGLPLTPYNIVRDIDSEYRQQSLEQPARQNVWFGHPESIKPIIMTGQSYNPGSTVVSGSELRQFIDALKVDRVTASPTGYKSVNWFDGDFNTATMRQAIASTSIGESITGVVYDDTDGDGTRDSGEDGIAGRRVYIDADNDKHFDRGELSDLTNEVGAYIFAGLPAGTYKVRQVPVSGWRQTNPSGGYAWKVTIGSRETSHNRDFGSSTTAALRGTVFNDVNGNGIQDSGEKGRGGILVYLDLDHDKRFTPDDDFAVTTDESGNYTFTVPTPEIGGQTLSIMIDPRPKYRRTTKKITLVRDSSGAVLDVRPFGVKRVSATA
jgi:hypothetical protein